MTTFGERLRTLRREAGLSQGDLAGEGLSASYISLLEAGKRSPSSEALQQLAGRLRCSTTLLLEGKPSERDQRIELEIAYARLAVEHGESADARVRLERLLAEDGIPVPIRDEMTFLLGTACERSGDIEAAVGALLPLYDRSAAGASHIPVSLLGVGLCRCYLDSGDLNRAAVVGEQALAAARDQGLDGTVDFFRLAATVMYAYTNLGDFLHARTWAEGLIAEAEATGQSSGQASLYWNAAIIAEHEGRMDESVHLCQRAMAHLSELDNTRDFARLRLAMAGILFACDPPQVDQGSNMLERALDDLRDLGSRVDLAEWNYVKSTALLHLGDLSGAEGRARQALDLLDGKASSERSSALLALSDALAAQGRDEDAADARALVFGELAQSGAGGRATALQWRELAERMAQLGDQAAAAEAYRHALDGAGVRDRSRAVREVVDRFRVGVQSTADAR
jgi:transcriptional regulator with XRE-family HTH domain